MVKGEMNAKREGKDNKKALTERDPEMNFCLQSVHSFRTDMVLTLSSMQWYKISYNIYFLLSNSLDFPFTHLRLKGFILYSSRTKRIVLSSERKKKKNIELE